MTRSFSFSAWLRGLLAVALVLAQLAPTPVAAMPDWLAAAICHAPSDNAPDQPSHAGHEHCALCQVAEAVGLPPVPGYLPLPHMAYATPEQPAFVAHALPAPIRAYAPRAPPRIG